MSAVVMSVLQGRLKTAPSFEEIRPPLQSWAGSKALPSHTWKSVPGISQIGLSTIPVQDPLRVPPFPFAAQCDTAPLFLVLNRGTKIVCRFDPDIGGFLAFSTPMMFR